MSTIDCLVACHEWPTLHMHQLRSETFSTDLLDIDGAPATLQPNETVEFRLSTLDGVLVLTVSSTGTGLSVIVINTRGNLSADPQVPANITLAIDDDDLPTAGQYQGELLRVDSQGNNRNIAHGPVEVVSTAN